MASAVGFATLPVIPSFSNISNEIERKIAQPLAKASKSAGEAIEKGVGGGAEDAAKAVEKAQYRVLKSTQELETAESKLTEQKLKSEAADKAVEAAARKRAEAEGKGVEAVEKAEQDLLKKRAAAEKASRDLASAEQGVERAMAESARAAKSLEDRQKALADAQDETADSAKRSMSVMDRFKASAEGVGSGLMRAAEGMKVHATVALGAIGGLLASSTAYASEAEQSYGAVESIFAGHADAIVAKSKEAAAAVGLSGREYRELSSVTGAMLKNMGLPMDEVTAKTQDLVGVAADLSATFGGSTKDAIEAVNALMRGEADPIERYGVSIKKADVNARLAAEGLDKLEGEALKQAEAQTLLAMLTEQTASAQGQFARETDTAAHKQQVATARMNDAREAIGTGLLPVMASLAEFGAKVAEKIGEHPRIFLAVAGAVSVLAAGIVGLAVAAPIFTAISVAAGAAGMSMWGYVAAQAAAIAPIAAVVAGVAALAAGLTYFFTQTEAGQAIWEKLVTSFQVGVEKIKGFFGGIADTATTVYDILFNGDFKGNNGLFGLDDESSRIVDFLFSIRDTALQVYNILFKGDYTAGSGFFGLSDESSKFVNALFVVRDTVIAVKDGVVAAFVAMGNAIKWAWDSVIKPVWDGLATAAQWVATILLTVLIAPVIVAWNALAAAFKAAWDVVIKPTWDAMAAVAMWLWQGVLVPAFNGIQLAFQLLGDGIVWVWNTLIKPTWDLVAAGINWLWLNVFVPATDGIKWLWNTLGDGIRWVWDNVIKPAWDAIAAGMMWLWESIFAPVIGWIVDKWNWMGDGFNAVKNFVVDTVFGGFQRGLDTLRDWVGTTADAMGRLWDGIRAKFAEPINFVIRVVYNDGIKKVFDAVAEKVGLDSRLPAIPSIGGYARGGILPGYTPGRDPYTFIEPRTGMSIGLSGGEAILRPEATRALGPQWVDNINRAARSGGRQGVERALMHSHFATGGIVHLGNFANGGFTNLAGALTAVQRSMGEFVGRFFPGAFNLTSATRPGDPGFHGRGLATDWQAKDGQYQSQMPTPYSKALARAIYTNFRNSTELIHWPLDGWENLKNGAPLNYGAATNAQHGNHVHWAIQSPLRFNGDDIVLDDVPGAGGSHFSPLGFFNGLWDRIIGKLPTFDLDGFGDLAKVPGAALKTLGGWVKDWALDQLKKWADKFMNFFGFGGGGAEQWRDLAREALHRMGYGDEYLEAMMQQIEIESGGNPNAVNNWDSNAAKGTPSGGLLQVIDPTYRDVRNRYPEAFEGLPDDRFHPLTNLVAGVGAVKRDWGGPGGRWPTRGGYASGGVLPGFTPGRDVHKFFSPTGGVLALSGGEAIMVPEWTRAVGGPAAVAAMNRAASGGRAGGSAGSFAGGGVWGVADDYMAQFREATANLNEAAGKLADPNTLEGISARAGLSWFGEFASALGFDSTSKIVSGVLGAEKELLDAREQHATRMKDLADKESALEAARKALSDAESASYDDDAKRQEAIAKATDDVAKAEAELVDARKKSTSALDMRIFDVAPQIHGMLSQAAAATSAIPALSGALGGLAAAAGPAGISVGVAVQAVMTGINLFKTVMGAISDFVSGIFDARAKMFALHAQALQQQYEWAKAVDNMRAKVVELRVSWVEAQVALRDAAWKTRLAQADVVRAQLQGVKTVAEAEAKLEAERKRVARAAARDLNDLSLLYDRYRWLEYQGLADRLDLAVTVTPEILALEAEVNAAKLTALANQRSASLAALQASWEQQKAALNLQQVQASLALQTQQLALMQAQFGGMGQAESLQAMNTAKLYEERSKAQGQRGKSFWRLSYWLTGAGSADKKRIAELDRLIAEREAEGKGAGAPVKGTGWMSFFGYGDSASNAVKNGGYGSAEEAMWKFQEAQQLQQIELQKQQLEQQIEQNKLFVEYQKQIGDLTAEIEALKAGASSEQYKADAYRENNPAVKSALEALARFEADRSAEYSAVSSGRKQVVEITIPAQDMYSREQVDALLRAVQQVQSIDARVTVLETPAKPGANQVLQDISRRY